MRLKPPNSQAYTYVQYHYKVFPKCNSVGKHKEWSERSIEAKNEADCKPISGRLIELALTQSIITLVTDHPNLQLHLNAYSILTRSQTAIFNNDLVFHPIICAELFPLPTINDESFNPPACLQTNTSEYPKLAIILAVKRFQTQQQLQAFQWLLQIMTPPYLTEKSGWPIFHQKKGYMSWKCEKMSILR